VIIDTRNIVLLEQGGSRVGVLDVSLACCALETRAALLLEKSWAGEELSALVLLISGTISQKLAQQVHDLTQEFWDFQPGRPHFLVAVGACATSGGPYWDSPTIVPGMEKLGLTCDLFIPGCPPRPAEIRSAIFGLLAGRSG